MKRDNSMKRPDTCKWSKNIKTTDESYMVCTNDNTEWSFADCQTCKYFEKEGNEKNEI